MKFNEQNYIEVQQYGKRFIYFLLNEDDEVVYIGKTIEGLYRPLSHRKKKEFSKIFIIYEDNIEKLGVLEDYLICKYMPKYNKLINNTYSVEKIRDFLKKHFFDKKYGLRRTKELLKEVGINIYKEKRGDYPYARDCVKIDDVYRLVNYLYGEDNYGRITKRF